MKINDERIRLQRQKIGSDTFGILYIGLIVSTLYQQLILNAPFTQYCAEFILFMISGIYIVVRNILIGNGIFGDNANNQKIVILNSLVSATTITAIITFLNSPHNSYRTIDQAPYMLLTSIIVFIISVIIAFLGFETLYFASKKRQEQIEKKFND